MAARASKSDLLNDLAERLVAGEEVPFEPLRQRGEVMEEAIKVITTARPTVYGTPENNFAAIASLWTGYFKAKYNIEFEFNDHDVSMAMVLMKVGRIATGQVLHKDNYVDGCGYLDIAYTLEDNR